MDPQQEVAQALKVLSLQREPWSIQKNRTETLRKTHNGTQRNTVKTIRSGHHTFIYLGRQRDPVQSHMDPRH